MLRLATRLRQLGYPVAPAKTADRAEHLLSARGSRIGAAVIPVDLPAFDLATALRGSGRDLAQGLLVAILAAMTVGAMVLLPSARARSWAKVKVAKHRNGPIGEVPVQFRKANTRFYSVAAREEVAAY